MHPLIKNHPELKKLYEADKEISVAILGSTGIERKKLIRLRREIQNKIRAIDPWDRVREQIQAYKEHQEKEKTSD